MPELIYNVKFQIDEASLEQVSQASSRATGGATGGGQTFYEQNINNSKRYQAVIKQELNLIVNQTQARQRSANSLDQVDKKTRDFINTLKDETAAVRAATAQTRIQENVSNENLLSLARRSDELEKLLNNERLLAIAQERSHPLYRTANQLISAGSGAVKTATSELGRYGTQILEISRSTTGLISIETALIQAVKAKTDEVRRYNSIVEVRGSLATQQEIEDYQRAAKELEELRMELLQVANAAESVDSSQIREMNQALRGAGQAATSADRYLSGMAGQMSGVNRLGNNSNQIFLAFGDAIQDSAQFSYGFANGMRAVGNNLTFAAEQFSYAYQRAGSMSDLLREFRGTLLGPVGVIVAFNAVVTLVTVYGDRIRDAINPQAKFNEQLKEQAEELSKIERDYKSIAQSILEIRGAEGGFRDINTLIEQSVLIGEDLNKINEEISRLEPIQALQDEYAQLARLIQSGVATDEQYQRYLELSSQTDVLGVNTSRLNTLYEQRIKLNGQLAETQLNISQAIQDGQIVDRAAQEEAIRLRRERMSQDIAVASSRIMIGLGQTELEAFIENEEKKRQESEKTARMRAFYERFYLIEGQKVAQTYSSVWAAHYGITNEDAEDNVQAQRDNASMILRATTQLTSQLMTLRSQNSAQSEQEARKQFETNKKLAYASAVVSGAAAIVDVIRQQKGGVVARSIAAGLIAAAVGVQIAQIKQQQFSYGGGSGMSSGGSAKEPSFGFEMTKVEGPQTFRTPAFTPTNENRPITPKVDVKVMADRKQLYAVVKRGEEEYRTRQA